MNGLFHTAAGGQAQRVMPGQTLDLTAPRADPAGIVFQRTVYLRIALDAACDRPALTAASVLALQFQPCTVAVDADSDDWVQRWQGGARTRVELAWPAPVIRVDSALYGAVALHRVDGEAVAEQPTASASTGAALSEPFVAVAFEARLSADRPGVRQRRKAELIARRQAHRSLSAAAVGRTEKALAQAAPEQAVEWLYGLSALHLAGVPSSPRLTLRSADGGEVLWQWLEPGPQAATVTWQPAALAEAWQAALERALGLLDANGPRPAVLVLPLEIASDAPCRVHVMQAQVGAVLERSLLTGPVTLRFDGSTRQRQARALTPPSAARRVQVEGQWTRTGDGVGAPAGTPLAHGVRLTAGARAEVPVRLTGALRCTGAAFAWHSLAAASTLAIGLHGPQGSGAALASAHVELDAVAAGTCYARWPALDLQAGAYTLRLAVQSGAGVLAGSPQPVDVPLLLSDAAGERPLALAAEVTLLGGEAGGAGAPPLSLALDGVGLTLAEGGAGRFSARLETLPAALADSGEWALSAVAEQPLTVQITDVRVAYETG